MIPSFNLKEYQKKIDRLAKDKGWQDDSVWLAYGMSKEIFELCQAWEHGKPQSALGQEFAGAMHFIFQFMKKHAPRVDLDRALQKEIARNYRTKKKTYENGRIVRK